MDIEQLRQLDAIARHGSLSAATKVCHVSQSALSRSIQRLEAEFGTKLFVRASTRMELNDAGRIVLEHARAILGMERAMHDSIDRLMQRERTLVVGTVAPSPVWLLTALTVEKYPGTILQIDYISNSTAASLLLDRSIDIAITTVPLDLPDCASTRILEEHLSLMMPSDHRLAGNASVRFSQMDGESFLVDSTAGFWVDVVREHLPRARIIEQADRNILFQLVASSRLLTFSTNATASWGMPKGFEVAPIEDEAAHVSFYLTALPSAPNRVLDIVKLAEQSSGFESLSLPALPSISLG